MGPPAFSILVLALVSQSLEVSAEEFGVQCQEESRSRVVEGEMVNITDCTRSVTDMSDRMYRLQ